MPPPKLLVIGSRGFLGCHVLQLAGRHFQVFRGDRSENGSPGALRIDIADEASVDEVFRIVNPDGVLLLAAISDIDACERAPELAFASNVRGPENVARACGRYNARLLFTSSAAVFDGRTHGYREDDQRNPLSVYGKTKQCAENSIKEILPSTIILRVALVVGFAGKPGTNAMLDRLMTKWKKGEVVRLPTREIRNPIDAVSLARIMLAMLLDPVVEGTFHVGASDSVSRFELAKLLAKRADVSLDLVQPQVNPMPGRAERGEDHFLLTDKIRTMCKFEIPTVNQVVERCFS
jgi:dTDP-4-dehydrorhamnose reductase